MEFEIISSSSKGNCIVIEKSLMLDCGISYKTIKPYLDGIKLIFISHIHKDHLNPTAIKQIAYNYPNIRFVCGSKEVIKTLYANNVKPVNIFYLEERQWYSLRFVKLKLERLDHDTPNHCLHFEIGGKKGIYIVDTSNVDEIVAKDYDLYLIESNYNQDILDKHILECEDENELYYLNRVPRTHLSFEQANSFLIENMKKESWFEYIHQSNYNFEERD